MFLRACVKVSLASFVGHWVLFCFLLNEWSVLLVFNSFFLFVGGLSWVAEWRSYLWIPCWVRWSWPQSSESPVWLHHSHLLESVLPAKLDVYLFIHIALWCGFMKLTMKAFKLLIIRKSDSHSSSMLMSIQEACMVCWKICIAKL